MKENKIENNYCSFELKDEILVCRFKKGVILDIAATLEVIELRTRITEGKSYPVLIMDEGIGSVTKESRDYFASEKGTQGITAAAMVYSNPFNRMVARFFLLVSVNKLFFQVDIFSNESKALNWLSQFI